MNLKLIVPLFPLLCMVVAVPTSATTYTIDNLQIVNNTPKGMTFWSKISCDSYSMGNTIDCNDIIYGKRTGNYKIGDIIAYRNLGRTSSFSTFVVHRINDIKHINNEKVFVTKGDANLGTDYEAWNFYVKEKEIKATILAVKKVDNI